MARGKKAERVLTPEEKLEQALVPAEEQPYEVPGNWCWTRLKALIETSKEKTDDFSDYNIKYVGLEHMEKDQGIIGYSSATEVRSLKSIFHVGQILYGKLRPYLNKHDIADFEGVCSTDILVFDIRDCAYNRYVNYFFNLRYFIEYAISNSKGINLPRVSESIILEAVCPLPPRPEQQRIVDRIDHLFAKLDEAKKKAQAVLDGFELRKSAILHKAFTGELTAQWREEHGLELDSWTERMLKDCGDWYGGGTPSMAHPEYWEGGELLWITSKDMKSDVIEDTLMHTNRMGVNNSSANYIEKPSILFVMRSGILRRTLPIAMVKVPFTVNQDLKVISPVDDINLEYFFWGCKNSEKKILNTCMKNGTTVESINAKALMNFKIPVASQAEQTVIVNCIVSLLDKEQQAKEATESVLTQIDTMKKSILARAFRGELGTNDPTEESALELLKTIL